jgi:hypothetical protein
MLKNILITIGVETWEPIYVYEGVVQLFCLLLYFPPLRCMSLLCLPVDVVALVASFIPVVANYNRLRQTCTLCYTSIDKRVPVTIVTLSAVERRQNEAHEDREDEFHFREESLWNDPSLVRFEATLSDKTIKFIDEYHQMYSELFGVYLERFSAEDFRSHLSSKMISILWRIAVVSDWAGTARNIGPLIPDISSLRTDWYISHIRSWDLMQVFIELGFDFHTFALKLLRWIMICAGGSPDMPIMFDYLYEKGYLEKIPTETLQAIIMDSRCRAPSQARLEMVTRLLGQHTPVGRWIEEASHVGSVEVLQYFRDVRGVPVDLNHCLGLHSASTHFNPHFIRYLIALGADFDRLGPLRIRHASTESIIQLIKMGMKVDSESLVDTFTRSADEGNYEDCESLLDLGFDINAKDKDGLALIHRLLHREQALRWVIRFGADIDLPGGQNGSTPLIMALEKSSPDTVLSRLLFEGANPRIRDANGHDAFHYGKDKLIELLRD